MTMLGNIEVFAISVGGIAGCYLLVAFGWSIAFPERRIWPPKQATAGIKLRVWIATISIFAATFVLGIADWNSFGWPAPVRWGIGLALIIIGNVVVSIGVRKIGFNATSGAVAELKTDGLYRYSRNPQYVADMVILVGWAMLSASGWAAGIAALGIVVLAAAPFAEEPWLEDIYGADYRAYKIKVRRYI
ncbi:isoprenylcysteine carboxylmethyltransferase family protein [uncultured Sulfitobacter sp.]|uniref:methyltransferase family protein n=1 Tax=uncultured Sulfitobacter sp. TaxID=191468 RepID=UPI002610AB16|nr:PEMT/PEM2 methyltransferase family protein [uncultured Sulfitobacter sp.]